MRTNVNVDKTASIATVLCFIYWILVKIPTNFFAFIYEATWLYGILIALVCPIYFLVKWIMNKFTFKKIYFYAFLLGVVTLLIMRFIFSITSNGITWMPDYN